MCANLPPCLPGCHVATHTCGPLYAWSGVKSCVHTCTNVCIHVCPKHMHWTCMSHLHTHACALGTCVQAQTPHMREASSFKHAHVQVPLPAYSCIYAHSYTHALVHQCIDAFTHMSPKILACILPAPLPHNTPLACAINGNLLHPTSNPHAHGPSSWVCPELYPKAFDLFQVVQQSMAKINTLQLERLIAKTRPFPMGYQAIFPPALPRS